MKLLVQGNVVGTGTRQYSKYWQKAVLLVDVEGRVKAIGPEQCQRY